MKRCLVLITILALISGFAIGCGKPITYHNAEFGYSVKMPASWEVVEKPVHWITGTPLKNTVGFRSELSLEADWVNVEIRTGESAYSAISKLRLTSDWSRVYEYGKNGYVHETRLFPEKSSRITYYIEHNNRLYVITFNKEKTCKKVYVSIDGYGKVNY